MAHSITWERQGIVRTFSGCVTYDEVFTSSREFYRDPRSHSMKYQLIDFTRAENMELSADDAEVIASISAGASASLRGLKVALVSNNQEIIEILEQYASLGLSLIPSWQFKIFRSLGKARHWIDTGIMRNH